MSRGVYKPLAQVDVDNLDEEAALFMQAAPSRSLDHTTTTTTPTTTTSPRDDDSTARLASGSAESTSQAPVGAGVVAAASPSLAVASAEPPKPTEVNVPFYRPRLQKGSPLDVAAARIGSLESEQRRHPGSIRRFRLFLGNNRILCNGKLITGPELNANVVAVFVIVLTTVLFVAFEAPYLMEHVSPAVLPGALYLCFMTSMSMALTAFTDPGILPRNLDLEGSAATNPLPRAIAPKPTDWFGDTMLLKWCPTCRIHRPPRVSHCSTCDNCVERFDHHCPWVGSCIGRRNYRYFYSFLVFTSLSTLYYFGFALYHLLLLQNVNRDAGEKSPFLKAMSDSPSSPLLMGIVFFFGLNVIGLSCYHTHLVFSDQTTNEMLKSMRQHDNSASVHCANFIRVLWGPLPPSFLQLTKPVQSSEMEEFAAHVREQHALRSLTPT
ncbi:hypothetical protein CAOG_08008 [Capsaspora owczarzaki ATCC 30864]|uniref:Palmitoyltransferase n=1 Tax=Capsaspora owczarzaki (strain ATCC 30864) TaxID=595528 RepID=A0A0D2USJ6_CAPO3|nr:hypothetical protein CAOG_08008 [Capsaspora owczarzaki ATCC 30864]KJE97941.1 hypothetical protein CAOG_008008 [Capsaspora owczarzaki ATCC 30864]|eukprot:XP_004342609.1 hypothetical protein CAOG_08008 [Capsaspora owczarzaki ATCC 30864]